MRIQSSFLPLLVLLIAWNIINLAALFEVSTRLVKMKINAIFYAPIFYNGITL